VKCAIAAGVDLLNPDFCRVFLMRRLHPVGGCCPVCRLSLYGLQNETFKAGGRVHCNDCGRWFTWRTDSILQGSTADERQIFLLVFLTSLQTPVLEISAACQLSTDTVRVWQRRFREGCR